MAIASRKAAHRVVFGLSLGLLMAPTVFFFYWMISLSLKTDVESLAYPPVLIPRALTLANYAYVFANSPLPRFAINSVIVAVGSTGLSLLLGIPAGYGIARSRRYGTALLILVARMTPALSYLIPWFLLFQELGLANTYQALILTHLIIGLPLVIWVMIGFFEGVPLELEDAALIDGCSRWQSFILIVLPLMRNGIATSAIMAFIFSWNQFLFSLILSGPQTKTVPVAVYNFISYGKIDWAGIGAAATLIVLPVSIFAFFVRKSIVQGLTMGALKD